MYAPYLGTLDPYSHGRMNFMLGCLGHAFQPCNSNASFKLKTVQPERLCLSRRSRALPYLGRSFGGNFPYIPSPPRTSLGTGALKGLLFGYVGATAWFMTFKLAVVGRRRLQVRLSMYQVALRMLFRSEAQEPALTNRSTRFAQFSYMLVMLTTNKL